MNIIRTGSVPAHAVDIIRTRLADVAARLVKRGLSVPTLSIGASSFRPDCDLPHVHRSTCPTVEWVDVSIVGEPPRHSGWTLVCGLDDVDGSVIIRAVPGETVPESFRDADPTRCDHCGIDRQRNVSYVLRHDDGRYMQAGSTCIRDYLGWDVSGVLSLYGIVYESLSGDDDRADGGSGWSGPDGFPFRHIVEAAALIVSVDGRYTKRADVEFDSDSTAGRAARLLYPSRPRTKSDDEFAAKYHAQGDRAERIVEETMTALANIAERGPRGDWEYNLVTLMRTERVPSRYVNVVVSSVVIGLRAIDRKVDAATAGAVPSAHIGVIGDKVDVDVTIADVKFIDSEWGGSYLVTMCVVNTTNIVKWFASSEPDVNADNTTVYNIRGSVKKHDMWNGRASTVLTRCKVAPR